MEPTRGIAMKALLLSVASSILGSEGSSTKEGTTCLSLTSMFTRGSSVRPAIFTMFVWRFHVRCRRNFVAPQRMSLAMRSVEAGHAASGHPWNL